MEGYIFLFNVAFYWMTECMDFSEMCTYVFKRKWLWIAGGRFIWWQREIQFEPDKCLRTDLR